MRGFLNNSGRVLFGVAADRAVTKCISECASAIGATAGKNGHLLKVRSWVRAGCKVACTHGSDALPLHWV